MVTMQEPIFVELGLWISAFYVLSCYSYLYRYNRFFKFAEHTMIGAAAGHTLVMGLNNIRDIGINNIVAGNFIYILAFPLGLSLFARFVPKYSWIQRYGFAFMIGIGMSIGIRSRLISRILIPMIATINAVNLSHPMAILNSIIIVGWVTTVMLYFLFTKKYTSESVVITYVRKIGRWGIMAAIGFYLGQTVMTRLAFVINRLEFLLFQWLRIARL